jgi:hypothetical protein
VKGVYETKEIQFIIVHKIKTMFLLLQLSWNKINYELILWVLVALQKDDPTVRPQCEPNTRKRRHTSMPKVR